MAEIGYFSTKLVENLFHILPSNRESVDNRRRENGRGNYRHDVAKLQAMAVGDIFPLRKNPRFEMLNHMDLFDDEDKVRLFETQEKSASSIRNYAKVILPIALLVMSVIAVVMYLSLPGVGDVVKASKELDDQVYNYMLTTEKRTASEMTFYKCDGYFWVKVAAEPRSYPPSNPFNAVKPVQANCRAGSIGRIIRYHHDQSDGSKGRRQALQAQGRELILF